jgi:polysaccharide biosynthesis/export protein
MNVLRTIALLGSIAMLIAGCQSKKAETFDPNAEVSYSPTDQESGFKPVAVAKLDPRWLKPDEKPFRLGPGDRIEIEVIGDFTTMETTFVAPDGKIYYHLLDGTFVWGLTLPETKALLEKKLSRFINSPKVMIILRDIQSRRYWLLGRVVNSGIYPIVTPTTIVEAIARSGGLMVAGFTGGTQELADLNHSFIMRNGRMLPVNFHALLREGDMSQNIYLQPDDFIYLPSSLSKEVYVLGAVNKPSTVPFMNQVTVLAAISAAWGPVKGANLKQVAIIRGSLSSPKVAVIDYRALVTGQQQNIPLQARDIVYIPSRPYATARGIGSMVVETFIRTVAANEGSRAVSQTAETVGVQLQIGN